MYACGMVKKRLDGDIKAFNGIVLIFVSPT